MKFTFDTKMNNIHFINNTSVGIGGALYFNICNNLEINNVTAYGNTGNEGGALAILSSKNI